ncbi:MAG: response regulator [Bacteroidota bacterium]
MEYKGKLLVVDDSRSARAYIVNMFQEAGYQVYEAGNGKEALKIMEEYLPDGIILDLLMPEMDGMEMLEMLNMKGVRLPILVLTADIQDEVRQEVLGLGAAAMLNKPVDKNVLLDTLKSILK